MRLRHLCVELVAGVWISARPNHRKVIPRQAVESSQQTLSLQFFAKLSEKMQEYRQNLFIKKWANVVL